MGIPKLPVRVSVFCNCRKEPRFIHTIPRGIYTDFVICGGDYRELRREWIDSQVLAPVKLHVVYGAREILNSGRRGCAVRKHKVPSDAMKNEGLSAKCLRQAAGPSWVTSCATALAYARTSLSTAKARGAVRDRDRSWWEPHATQRTTNRKGLHCRLRVASFWSESISFRTLLNNPQASAPESLLSQRLLDGLHGALNV